MYMLPLISVIVPVYNVEKYLKECIDSILVQSYPHLELILIDDGSTDSSGEICDDYQADQRVRIIHNDNSGVSETRNIGIRSANGDYLVFVDSDDYLHPEMIMQMYEGLIQTKADIAISGFTYCFIDKKLMQVPQIDGLVSLEKNFNQLFSDLYPNNILSGPCNKMYKKEILRENGIYFSSKYSICEDGIFLYTYLLNCNTIYVLSQPLYFYRIREGEDHLMVRYHANAFDAFDEYYQTINRFIDKYDASKENRIMVNASFSSRYLLFLRELYAHHLNNERFIYSEIIKQSKRYHDVIVKNAPLCKLHIKEAALLFILKNKKYKFFHFIMRPHYRMKLRGAKSSSEQ